MKRVCIYPLVLLLSLASSRCISQNFSGNTGEKTVDNKSLINILDRGAIGDGKFDNWEIIQRAIDELTNQGGGTIFFPKGNYALYDKSLVIWGNNIILKGESTSSVKIIKRGKVGYFGECIDIAGKINGHKYYGEFGQGSYMTIRTYQGQTEKAKNIVLSNLTIDSQLSDTSSKRIFANNLGIINSDNVTINDCVIQNALQSNAVIVNDAESASNSNITFNRCVFQHSNQHNVRVISYNNGSFMGNEGISFNKCHFLNVLGADKRQKEIKGEKVLFWYRGAKISGKSAVSINNCTFDDSGIIFINSNSNGFSINNSRVGSSLNIQHSSSLEAKPSVVIKNTTFELKGDYDNYLKQKLEINIIQKLKNGFKGTSFGSVYPANLVITQ